MPKRHFLTTSEQGEQSLVHQFTDEEYRKGIATLKNNKAAGIDDMHHPTPEPHSTHRGWLLESHDYRSSIR